MQRFINRFVALVAAIAVVTHLPLKAMPQKHKVAIVHKAHSHINVRKIVIRPFRILATIMGQASWYGPGFEGGTTADGKTFSTWKPMCAERYPWPRQYGKRWPLGSKVRVTNTETGKSAICTLDDTGPLAPGRVIDLSRLVANQIGMSDLAPVRLQLVQ